MSSIYKMFWILFWSWWWPAGRWLTDWPPERRAGLDYLCLWQQSNIKWDSFVFSRAYWGGCGVWMATWTFWRHFAKLSTQFCFRFSSTEIEKKKQIWKKDTKQSDFMQNVTKFHWIVRSRERSPLKWVTQTWISARQFNPWKMMMWPGVWLIKQPLP